MGMAVLVFSSLSTILIRQYNVLSEKIGDYHLNPKTKTKKKVEANRRSKIRL